MCTDEDGAYNADFTETDISYEGYAVNKERRLAENHRTVLSKKRLEACISSGRYSN